MTFNPSHTPSTQFEKYLNDFLSLCSTLSKNIPKNTAENKTVRDGIVYYNSAFKSTLEKTGKAHEFNIPSFTRLSKILPSDAVQLSNLEWLTAPVLEEQNVVNTHEGPHSFLLRFVRSSDGEYAQKVTLNLTAIYNFALEEIDQYNFVYLLLRCCELAETNIDKQATIGRAAQEFEMSYEELDENRRESEIDDDSDVASGFLELKKRVFNPKIWKTVLAEGSEMLTAAQNQPEIVRAFEGLMSEDKTASEKFEIVKQLGDTLPAIKSKEPM